MRVLALCAMGVAALKMNDKKGVDETSLLQMKMTTRRASLPRDQGFSHPWDRDMIDDEGELDIHAVDDASDEVDSNHYVGENEKREQINEQVTHWRQSPRHPVIVHAKSAHFKNNDLW